VNGSPHFYGMNAWMPYKIGPSDVYYGKLVTDPDDPIWDTITASNVGIMRYGGRGVDHHANPQYQETLDQYVNMAVAMENNGIEPVLQVPVFGLYSASQAADIVRYVNFDSNGNRLARAVTYWVIGNEPNLCCNSSFGYGGDGSTVGEVATNIKNFASAMKAVDPNIKTIGPEVAWYDTNILNGLTTCPGTNDVFGGDANGTYLDIISFHTYPFDGGEAANDPNIRQTIIDELMSSGGFNADLTDLNNRVNACNSYHNRTSNPVKIAVTEANINYEGNYDAAADNIYGYWAKSFLGGQFWAEMMAIAQKQGVDFMTFWSVVEGSGLSYLASDGVTKRPTYYHFQMMAKYFLGAPANTTDTQANVKAFAAKDTNQIAVLIMNQNQGSTSMDYTVRLDTGTVSGTRPLKVSVDAGVAVEYTNTIAPESTVVLVFNSSGTLTKRVEYRLSGEADHDLPPHEY
jgi:hypothetical protein